MTDEEAWRQSVQLFADASRAWEDGMTPAIEAQLRARMAALLPQMSADEADASREDFEVLLRGPAAVRAAGAARMAARLREAIAERTGLSLGVLVKDATDGQGIRAADPALAAELRTELVRVLLRADTGLAVNVLDSFDFGFPRGWSVGSTDDEPWPYAGTYPAEECVHAAWELAREAIGVSDPAVLARLRSEVAALLAAHPAHLPTGVAQVDAIAEATKGWRLSGVQWSKRPLAACPRCKSRDVLPIVHSDAEEVWRDDQAGLCVFAGCVITEGQPTRACRGCGERWRPKKRKRKA